MLSWTLPCILHVLPTPVLFELVTLIIFGEENKLRHSSHYIILSINLFLSPSQIQIFSSTSCSPTPHNPRYKVVCYTYAVHTSRGTGNRYNHITMGRD
jgi:hypothetical protein